MRWIFLTLVLLNLLFAVLEWQAGMGGHRGQEKGYLLASGGERLLLLGEQLQTFSAGRNEGERGDLCLLVGPLRDRGNAKLLIEALGHSDVGAGLVTQAIVKAPNYWVYLEPYESRKSAIVKLRELKLAKVDSYLITQGELANGISLGVFENIDSARRMLERRQGQGYPVKVTELGKKDFEYWVAVDDGYTVELDAKVTKIMNKIEMMYGKRQISCKSVASEKKLP